MATTKMEYIARLHLDKTVDTWGPDGAGGTCRFIFDESRTVRAEQLTGPKGLNKPITSFLELFGLDFSKFEVFEQDYADEQGQKRFTFSRVEDDEGIEDEDGKWLADYSLHVETFEATRIETPDFGLPTT